MTTTISSNVRPRFVSTDAPDGADGYSVVNSDGLIDLPSRSAPSNTPDIILGKPSFVMRDASHDPVGARTRPCCVSPLCDSVRRVFLVCSNPKMIWVNAWRIVARMAHAQPVRNHAFSDQPCEPVSAHVPSVKPHYAVPIRVDDATPRPAFIRVELCESFPKSGNVVFGWVDLSRVGCNALFRFFHTSPMTEFSGSRPFDRAAFALSL